MKKRKTILNPEGSYSVEAALIMWIVISLVIVIIGLGLYLRDRMTLYTDAMYYTEMIGHLLEEPVSEDGRLTEIEFSKLNKLKGNGTYWKKTGNADFKTRFLATAKNHLLIMEVTQVAFNVTEDGVILSYRAEFSFPGGELINLITGSFSDFGKTVKYEISVCPEEFLRLCHGLSGKKE